MLLLALLACVDYRFGQEPVPPAPELTVLAAPLEAGLCPDSPAVVELLNEGDGPLTVSALGVEGEDWVLAELALPATVAPGAVLDVVLVGEGGESTLVVTTNDADEPVARVPIVGTANVWPTARIVSPVEEEVIPAEGDLTFVAFVGDDDDALSDLTLEWVSSLTGPLGTSVPDEDGRATFVWPEAERVGGPQFVYLSVTDPCGGDARGLAWYCQEGPYVVRPIEEEAWRYEGPARVEDGVITLTDAAPDTVASAFDLSSLFDGDNVSITFDFQVDPGGGGEGLSVTLLDANRREGFVGGDGCGLGFGGGAACTSGPALPGWSLAVDTRADPGDCLDGPHLAFTVDGDVGAFGPCAPLPPVSDGAWHTLALRLVAGVLTVTLDGAEVLAEPVPTVVDFPGFVGFTASTGAGGGDAHRVRAVEIVDYTCE